ncbi:MAG: T9SS type A sorting domain-containing protein [Flavobacteriales bacterium]|nr:T9SS type A sorting domain-containing protein [Flavobacteriales bacterium]
MSLLLLQIFASNDDISDMINVGTTSTATGDTYTFLLTNMAGEILAMDANGQFDLGAYPAGTYFVWGVSYDGEVSGIEVGAMIQDISFVDGEGCFDISTPLAFTTELCSSFELIACAPEVTVECGSDLNNYELTGFPVVEVAYNDGDISIIPMDEIIPGDDCGYTIIRTWVITLGDLSQTCTQVIHVVDTQGPVFGDLLDVSVQCLEEVPALLEVSAWDACSGEVPAEGWQSQTGEVESECVLSTAFGPGADWAVWLPVLASDSETSSANFVFDANGGHFDQFIDGTAHLYGTVVNTANANEQFVVDLKFENKADWAAWSALGRNYKNDLGLACATADHINWSYYELVGGFSTLTGAGDLAGDVLYLYHMPADFYFGFQVGIGANNKNCNNGLSGWFTYNGFVGGEKVEGHGDVNTDADCEPVNDNDCIHHTSFTQFYRAVDACGHATIESIEIVVDDTTAPEFTNCPESLTIECSDAIPAVAEGVSATDNCSGDVAVVYLGETSEGDACETVLTRVWAATDVCGNRTDCVQTITIRDTTAPVLNGTPDAEITVECDAVPAAAEVTATDNCQEIVNVEYAQSIEPGNCPGYYTISRNWYATDSCGNDVAFNQIIHVQDTTAPEFDPYDFYAHIECDEIPAVITAHDNCGEATVVVIEEVLNSGGCLGVYHRVYEATDECGNTATAEQYISILDTTAPVIYGVPADATIECNEVSVGENGNYFGNDGVYGVDNCEMEVTITYSEEVVPTDDDCPQSYDIIRTWVAIDYCDNVDSASQTVHVIDSTAPSLYIPQSYEASCDAELEYADASAEDNCGAVSISELVDTIPGSCPQSYTITRTFVATDECGNSSEPQTQYIEVIDWTAPMFGYDNQYYFTYECDEEVELVQPSATDNCGEVSYSHIDTLAWGNSCYNGFTRVWTATDECGNSSNWYQYIYIQDTTAPVITGELEITRPCDDYMGIFVTATDNCNGYTFDSWDEFASGSCAGNVIRHYTAWDSCQNQSEEFVQIIHLTDEVAPEIVEETADFEVECGEDYSVPAPIFADNCDEDLDITSDVTFEVVDCVRYETYTWTAVDHCNNATTSTTVVTIVDTLDPWFENFPADEEVSCDQELPAVVYPLAYDQCDEEVEVELAIDSAPGSCPQEMYIYRTFRGFDECGNQVVETQTIHVVDHIAPMFGYDNQYYFTYECDEEVELVQPSATDNCGEVSYSHVDTLAWGNSCYNGFTRVWTATDECGNSNNWYQYIYIQDTTAPVISGELEITRPCDDYMGIFVTATDNCNGYTFDSWDEFASGSCAGNVIRHYTAWDSCQNQSEEFVQIIHLTDAIAPEIVEETADFEVECGEYYSVVAPIFADNCDEELDITSDMTSEVVDCVRYETYTWTAVDHCNNSTTSTTVVTIVDTQDPWFVGFPSNMEVSCDQEMPVVLYPSAYDNCDEQVEIELAIDTVDGDCPQEKYYNYTFRAYDDCGNDVVETMTIHVYDYYAPMFDYDNEYYFSYECDEEVELVQPSATDNCGEVSYSHMDTLAWGNSCYNGFTRVWTATDECGNNSQWFQYIYIQDTTAPVISGELEVSRPCDDYMGNFVTVTDNCNDYSIDSWDETASGSCAGNIIRHYTAWDDCQNQSLEFVQIIHLTDTVAPVIENAPENIEIECGDSYPAYEPIWSDNCDEELDLSAISSINWVGCNQVISQVYFAVDHCGNESSVSRTITIVDTTAPVLSNLPEDESYSCDQVIPVAEVTADDVCDGDLDVTHNDVIIPGNCPATYEIVRTFYAVDGCGNDVSYDQHISVSDNEAPEFTFIPEGGNYTCEEGAPFVDAQAEDNCSTFDITSFDVTVDTTIVINFAAEQVTYCGTLITRYFVAEDACGNADTASTVYFVYDNVAPTFDQDLSDVYVQCASDIPAPVEVTATDNCTTATVSVDTDVLESDTCGNQTILVIYTAIDECGNTASTSYQIIVNDDTDPEFVNCPSDIVLACDAEIPAPAAPSATDNCDQSVDVSYEQFVFGDVPAEGSIADCDLITPVRPADNPCVYPYDWAMVMFGMPTAHKWYYVSEGSLVQYPDGSTHLEATMNNVLNPANGWYVNVWFSGNMDWSTWASQSFPTGFKGDCGGVGANHEAWAYSLLMAGEGAELVGFGSYNGSSLNLVHAPINNYFGFQLGDGANNYNDAYGFGGWFSYSGTFMDASISGAGDFAFELDCCPDYWLVRQWTAVDCSGNSSTCTQTITFEGTEPVVVTPQAPVVSNNETKAESNLSVMPNPATDKTMFSFTASMAGKTTLEVFDMTGKKVADVFMGVVEAGVEYKVDYNVNSLATGIYTYRLTNGNATDMGKLIISK